MGRTRKWFAAVALLDVLVHVSGCGSFVVLEFDTIGEHEAQRNDPRRRGDGIDVQILAS